MAHEPSPSLALSDIIHVSSPSPVPVNHPPITPTQSRRTQTPEPMSDVERANILRRLTELGLSGKERGNVSARERELLDMVLRLSTGVPPDTSQLALQATAISDLLAHRNFLAQQAKEDRSRWESEKDGWGRTAEALLAQRSQVRSSVSKDDDLERQCATFESDNESLREKLVETQTRLASLESELTKLRPLLLMQPLALPRLHGHNPSMDSNPKQNPPRTHKGKEKRKGASSPNPFVVPIPEEQEKGDEHVQPAEESTNTPTNANNTNLSSHYRRAHKSTRPTKTSASKPSTSSQPLLSDARSEHLLLAARKIGRERAGIVSGLMSTELMQRERERERKQEEMNMALNMMNAGMITNANPITNAGFSPPKTPRRVPMPMPVSLVPVPVHATPTGVPSYTHTPPNAGFVFVNSPLAFTGSPMHPQYIMPYPPVQVHTPTRGKDGSGATVNPPTPLDSLLSAARSLMDDSAGTASGTEDNRGARGRARATTSSQGGTESGIGKARRARDFNIPESPLSSKRRKLAEGSGGAVKRRGQTQVEGEGLKSGGVGLGKVKSALDVLADQAAVFSSKEAGREKDGSGGDHRASDDLGHVGVKKVTARKSGGRNGKGKERDLEVREEKDDERLDEVLAPSRAEQDPHQFTGSWKTVSPNLRPVTRWNLEESLVPSGMGVGRRNQDREVRGNLDEGKTSSPAGHTPLHPVSSSPPLPSSSVRQLVEADGGVGARPGRGLSSMPHIRLRSRSEDARRSSRSLVRGEGEATVARRALSIPPHSPSRPRRRGRGRGLGRTGNRTVGIIGSGGGGDQVFGEEEREDEGTVAEVGEGYEKGALRSGSGSERGGGGGKGGEVAEARGQEMLTEKSSLYMKWSKDEDDLLAQAVAKYGEKWDLVQTSFPSREYDQVRQRWLRKLGALDTKSDLPSVQTGDPPGVAEIGTESEGGEV